MSVFDLYAAYYDLLYRDKDYAGEARHVLGLLEMAEGAGSILELGCGTGGHAAEFARQGISVHGIDLSRTMIDLARERCRTTDSAAAGGLVFEQDDIRTCRLGHRFDAVVSLFHVISYQAGNEDQRAAFETARCHLHSGGRFVFDFWYGPAVLTDRPRYVVKEVSDDRIRVERSTTPAIEVNRNLVDIRFDLKVESRLDGSVYAVTENHRMRYLFLPEIERLLEQSGFQLLRANAWMTDEELSESTWYGCVTARAV